MMGGFDWSIWGLVIGLGAIWHGLGNLVVGGLPRQLRKGPQPTAEKGTPEAFGLFWMDQYAYIGLTLTVGGLALIGFALVAG